MGFVYNLLIYNPFLNILIFFYNTIAFKDLGVAIVFLTILVRIILYPLSLKMFKQQVVIQKLQPQINEIRKKYKKDPIKQNTEILALYKKNKTNPFFVYLLILIQIPILFALFKIFSKNFNDGSLVGLYPFISAPENINTNFLGLINLTQKSIIIGMLAAMFQYFYTKETTKIFKYQNNTKANSFLGIGQEINLYLGVFFIFVFASTFPAAIGLYLLTTNIISFLTQIFINKKLKTNELGSIYPRNN